MRATGTARQGVTFAVLACAAAAFAMLQSFVIPVLPTLQAAFGTTQGAATWILTACLLSAAVCTPIMGRIGDLVGRKRILVVTLVLLVAGSLLAAVADSIGVMIFARVVQGVGGGVLPLSFGIVRDEFPPEKVAASVGAIASLTAIGAGLGVVLTGPIVATLGYRWLFWFPLIVIGLTAVAAWLFVPEPPAGAGKVAAEERRDGPAAAGERSERGGIGWLPALFLTAWLVALLLALSFGPERGWLSPAIVALLAGAVAAGALWAAAESRARRPLIDLRMMRMTAVWTTNLVALLVGIGLFATFGFLPQLVQTPPEVGYGFGATVAESGMIIFPSCVTQVAVGLLNTRLERRLGGKALVVAGCLACAASMTAIAFAHHDAAPLYVASAVLGFGVGLSLSGLAGLIVTAVPAGQIGVASGMNANVRMIGGSIGAALMASIVQSSVDSGGPPAEWGYTTGFAVLGASYLLAGAAALLIPTATGRPLRQPATVPA
ncbi:MFS transporter [Phytohabitans sp. ZYX-F-186]|uniref:MFS transporter n=1 Tax=Phytohabitans maris TaxID=3071409 RepID=A0ABU0Z9P8_9ACTN|nr:MFS transporter [Phytohabitans sp. ZYX-F-186]MDQ7903760.1 MFS transporter [Phytohabitans sp. ZYX-F-186]